MLWVLCMHVHSSNTTMTTFIDPDNPLITVTWDVLDAEEKQALCDRFRAKYIAKQDLSLRNGVKFDPATQEEKLIPLVVREWELLHSGIQPVDDGQWIVHPVYGINIDWSRATDPSRVLLAHAYEDNELVAPEVVTRWLQKYKKVHSDELATELAEYSSSDATIHHYRALAEDAMDHSTKLTQKVVDVVKDILAHSDKPHYKRKPFHDLFVKSNTYWVTGGRHNAAAIHAQRTLHDERAFAHDGLLTKMRMRHQQEEREAREQWDAARKAYVRLFDDPMQRLSDKVDVLSSMRKRVMETVYNLRESGLISNIGYNQGSLQVMEGISPGLVVLNEAQIDFVMKEVFPLLQAQLKKPVVNALGDKVLLAKNILKKYETRRDVVNINVSDLTMTLEKYNIKKPDRYASTIGYLGDGLSNYTEYAQGLRHQHQTEMQQKAMEIQANAVAKAQIEQSIKAQSQAESSVPQTNSASPDDVASSPPSESLKEEKGQEKDA